MTGSKEILEQQAEAEMFTPSNESPVNDAIARRVIPIHLTKASSEGNAEVIADLVKSGHYNALEVATRIKWMIATLEQANKLIQPDCVDEIEKHNGKATINGAEVIKKEVGTKYDYSNCNDANWNALNELMVRTKERMSEREKFLKTITKPLTIADDETGEMIQLLSPIKTSSTSIQVSFK